VALLLAAAGIYGVLSGAVTERQREIGVRAALGATRADLLGLVVRQGLGMTLIGVVLGIGGAVALSRFLEGLLFGVERLDPATYGGVVVLLGLVALAACLVPAWRAARLDPATVLRNE
jgi:ABC-type antimicrobial peptide transport system permease subunit